MVYTKVYTRSSLGIYFFLLLTSWLFTRLGRQMEASLAQQPSV